MLHIQNSFVWVSCVSGSQKVVKVPDCFQYTVDTKIILSRCQEMKRIVACTISETSQKTKSIEETKKFILCTTKGCVRATHIHAQLYFHIGAYRDQKEQLFRTAVLDRTHMDLNSPMGL